MSFANPWGLLGLLALPTIVAIHLFRRRFPPLVVAGLHLWGAQTQVQTAGRKRDRLPITPSLLLELLGALLLTLVLAQPRLGSLGTVPHLVVVLDDSASMSATDPDREDKSLRDIATDALFERFRDLPRGSRATLILTGRRPVLIAGPAAPWRDAADALEKWQPSRPRHDFQPAWDLATELAGDSAEMLFLTNRMPLRTDELPSDAEKEAGDAEDAEAETETETETEEEPEAEPDTPEDALRKSLNPGLPARMEVHAYGERLDNFAFTASRWLRDRETGKTTLFLRIANLGRSAGEVTVLGRTVATESTPAEVLFRDRLSVEKGGASSLTVPMPESVQEVQIDLVAEADRLAVDNTVRLIRPKPRTVGVALALPADHSAVRPLRSALGAVADVQIVPADDADLILTNYGSLPESDPGLWWLAVGPIDEEAAPIDLAPQTPYLIAKREPLVEGVTLEGVTWGGVRELPEATERIVSAGQYVLLGRLLGTRTHAYVLNLDLARTNITETYDWPILISNLVERTRAALPGPTQWNYRLGETVRFVFSADLPTEDDDLLLVSAGEAGVDQDSVSRRVVRTRIIELPRIETPGRFRLLDGDEQVAEFAVNFFDPVESDLLRLERGTSIPESTTEATGFRLDDPYSWLVFLSLLLFVAAVLVNWWVVKSKSAARRRRDSTTAPPKRPGRMAS